MTLFWTALIIVALLSFAVVMLGCINSARKSVQTGMPWDGVRERIPHD